MERNNKKKLILILCLAFMIFCGLVVNIFSPGKNQIYNSNFTPGLDKIDKLHTYRYTYKSDRQKTPQVGVIAQDLQKVFPNSVTKGKNGYLRITKDEMFYAMINSVKQLDKKIKNILSQTHKVSSNLSNIEYLTNYASKKNNKTAQEIKEIDEQQKKIDLETQKLEQRMAKLENISHRKVK